jgi:hypothetical protein
MQALLLVETTVCSAGVYVSNWDLGGLGGHSSMICCSLITDKQCFLYCYIMFLLLLLLSLFYPKWAPQICNTEQHESKDNKANYKHTDISHYPCTLDPIHHKQVHFKEYGLSFQIHLVLQSCGRYMHQKWLKSNLQFSKVHNSFHFISLYIHQI